VARNRIERFFNRLKHFRRLVTRHEKHAANFLALLKLAAIHLWLRHMSPCPKPVETVLSKNR
jgi:transposase